VGKNERIPPTFVRKAIRIR
jgi:diketogulonate reductase-like aldo/keto reductase